MSYLDPAIGIPLAVLLWLAVLVPLLARWNRARRADRAIAAILAREQFERENFTQAVLADIDSLPEASAWEYPA